MAEPRKPLLTPAQKTELDTARRERRTHAKKLAALDTRTDLGEHDRAQLSAFHQGQIKIHQQREARILREAHSHAATAPATEQAQAPRAAEKKASAATPAGARRAAPSPKPAKPLRPEPDDEHEHSPRPGRSPMRTEPDPQEQAARHARHQAAFDFVRERAEEANRRHPATPKPKANPDEKHHRTQADFHRAEMAKAQARASESGVQVAHHEELAAKARTPAEAAVHKANAATARAQQSEHQGTAREHAVHVAEHMAQAAKASGKDDEAARYKVEAAQARKTVAQNQQQAKQHRTSALQHKATEAAKGSTKSVDQLRREHERHVKETVEKIGKLFHTGHEHLTAALHGQIER